MPPWRRASRARRPPPCRARRCSPMASNFPSADTFLPFALIGNDDRPFVLDLRAGRSARPACRSRPPPSSSPSTRRPRSRRRRRGRSCRRSPAVPSRSRAIGVASLSVTPAPIFVVRHDAAAHAPGRAPQPTPVSFHPPEPSSYQRLKAVTQPDRWLVEISRPPRTTTAAARAPPRPPARGGGDRGARSRRTRTRR